MTAADVFTFSGDKKFENTAAPLEKNGFAYCQVMSVVQCWLFSFVSVCVSCCWPWQKHIALKQTDRLINRQTDRQTDRQRDRQEKEKDGRQVYLPV